MKQILLDTYYRNTPEQHSGSANDVDNAIDIVLAAIPPEVASLIPADKFTLIISTLSRLLSGDVPVSVVEIAFFKSLASDVQLLLPKEALGMPSMCKSLLNSVSTPLKDNVVKFPRKH